MPNPNRLPETREELDEIIDRRVMDIMSRSARQMWRLAHYQHQDKTAQALNDAGNALVNTLTNALANKDRQQAHERPQLNRTER